MEGNMMGVGIGAFWLFIAAVVVAGIWSNTREKEARQQTLKDLIGRAEKLDDETVEKLMAVVESDKRQNSAETREGLLVAYKIMLGVALGLVVLGIMVGAFMPMLGVGGLVACIAGGMYVAANSIAVEND